MKPLSPSLSRLADVTDWLVNSSVGILRSVTELRTEAGAPDFFHFMARCCNTLAFSRQAVSTSTGAASADRDVAASHAILQAIACYCAALYYPDELKLESAASAPFPCVPPEEFALYSRAQLEQPGFPWPPFERDTRICWTMAVDPLAGERVHVPAAMVHLPYSFDVHPGDQPIVQSISTGLACGLSPAQAAVSAISEVIECDALAIVWQARLGMPQIRIETLDDVNYDIVSRFERTGSSVQLLNITLDLGIPTVLACLRSSAIEAPALVFSAATNLDPATAVRNSLEKLAHTRLYAQFLKSRWPAVPSADSYEQLMDPVSHLRFWCDHERTALADFLFTSKERIEFDEIEGLSAPEPELELKRLLHKVRDAGHRVLLADLTTEDVRSLGLTVTRAILPGFHPSLLGHAARALGGSRLYTVPQRLGHPGIRPESADNPLPHPFP